MDVSSLLEVKKNAKIPDIQPGDTVRVSTKIVEGDKERIQIFQGVIIKIKRGGHGASYTVRHVAFGIGVERTFPLSSPLVEKVEVVRQGKVRRARLYYLRGLSGKEARRKIKRVERKARQVGDELLQQQPEEEIEPIMDEAAVAAAAEKAAAEQAVPEAAKEEKKKGADKKAKEQAPAAEKKEAVAEKSAKEDKPAEQAPVAEIKEIVAEKPAEPAQEPNKEEPKA
ncbi:MAG: 50S ribosomal protein L19 [Dehalococcoidales bacterium]